MSTGGADGSGVLAIASWADTLAPTAPTAPEFPASRRAAILSSRTWASRSFCSVCSLRDLEQHFKTAITNQTKTKIKRSTSVPPPDMLALTSERLQGVDRYLRRGIDTMVPEGDWCKKGVFEYKKALVGIPFQRISKDKANASQTSHAQAAAVFVGATREESNPGSSCPWNCE